MKRLALILGIAFLVCACQEEIVPSLELTSGNQVTVPVAGGTAKVTFKTNVPWTASLSSSEWASISPSSGEAGDITINVTALENKAEVGRGVDLKITAGDKNATVSVYQPQKDMVIFVTGMGGEAITGEDIDCAPQVLAMYVEYNADFKMVSKADWISLDLPTKAMNLTTELAIVEANTGNARTGVIEFQGTDGAVLGQFTVNQAAYDPEVPFIKDVKGLPEDGMFSFGIEGGNASFTFYTPLDVEVSSDADWVTVSYSQDAFDHSIALAAAANDGYDARGAYVTLTFPKVEFVNEDGSKDVLTASYYVYQEGLAKTAWRTEFFWDLYSYGGAFHAALTDGRLLATNAYNQGVFYFDQTTGVYGGLIAAPFIPTAITADNAGNIIITTGGNYPIDETTWSLIEEDQVPYDVYALPAGSSNFADAKKLISYYDGFYGYGLDNIRVSGDVFGDAVMVASSAGYGASYAVAWEIKGGEVQDPNGSGYTDYVTFYSRDVVYNTNNIINYPLGPAMSNGILGAGYATVDGTLDAPGSYYGLCYNPGTWSMNDWQFLGEFNQTWANAITGMDIVEWGGHKILVAACMSYFAYADWDYDGNVDGYMPGFLYVVNIDNPSAPEVISCYEYYASEDNWQYGSNADVAAAVENGNLCVYLVDAAASHIQKVVYPAK